MKKRWLKELFRQRVLVAALILLQLTLLTLVAASSIHYFRYLSMMLRVLSLFVVLNIIKRNGKSSYKLSWIILILLFPVFGGLFYLLVRFQSSTKRFASRQQDISDRSRPLYDLNRTDAHPDSNHFVTLAHYLDNYTGFPLYSNTRTCYLTPGEKKFDRLMTELRKAEKYIFLEYFIIGEGAMWNAILGVLKEKASEGVEVRLLYDDMGCFLLLPGDYPQTLAKFGIQCRVFSPFRPVLSTLQNNRDHRKIAVIDGRVAFTGGINLADEYINRTQRFGHWKDAAIMLEGDGAWSFALMFLDMWNLTNEITEDYRRFIPQPVQFHHAVPGLVQPYCDSPLDAENVGEHVYLQIINNAQSYLYINTPYLIVDDSMLSALTLSAKSGVDVRICTPQRWDKWLVHMTTRSYYRHLIRAGVKIYEYRDGFIHSKTFVSDDSVATVGTTNLDYRSLYLHFECGCCLYDTNSIRDIKEDYLSTLDRCCQITLEDCKENWLVTLFQEILRVFAPFM